MCFDHRFNVPRADLPTHDNSDDRDVPVAEGRTNLGSLFDRRSEQSASLTASEAHALAMVDTLQERLGRPLDEIGILLLKGALRSISAQSSTDPRSWVDKADVVKAAIAELCDARWLKLMPPSANASMKAQVLTLTPEQRRARAQFLEKVIDTAVAAYAEPRLEPWFDMAEVSRELFQLTAIPSTERSDSEKEYARFLERILNGRLLRRSGTTFAPRSLLELKERFPNFAGPIDFLAQQAALARLRGARRVHLPPILLAGPAGVGKTHFALSIAELLGSRLETIAMSSQSCGFALSGLERGWSTGRPGMIFNALQHGPNLAPVIVLDEIEKANSDARSDPLGPLYTLLEPKTAAQFKDEFAGFAIDASQVIWIATANDVDKLPGPLRSRFRVFEIAAPDESETGRLAQQIYQELSMGLSGAPEQLPHGWRERLAGRSLRDIRITLQEALGRAALRMSTTEVSEVSLEVGDLDSSPQSGAKSRKIGFVT